MDKYTRTELGLDVNELIGIAAREGGQKITARQLERKNTSGSLVEISTPASPSRRRVLRQGAVLVSATPFVVAGYGLLFGREDVEVVRQRVRLAHLPKGFDGFRIAQLSDIHMGPFTTANYIQRCVAITNGLKPDLIALTGDYIAWDPGLERRVVSVLAGLRAPHGVFGCLGNHEEENETEEYVSGSFTAQGIPILRQKRTPIRLAGDELNLIGLDGPRTHSEQGEEEEYRRDVNRRLHGQLVIPGTVNVLLSHEPSVFVFDRAADLGIDLMLSGHTHGGQIPSERTMSISIGLLAIRCFSVKPSILHRDERLTILLSDFVDGAVVGVVQSRNSAGLTAKTFQCQRVSG